MKEVVDFIKGFDYHTIIIVGVSFFWLNSNINSSILPRLDALDHKIVEMEKDLTIIKTVLFMKDIMPKEFCKKGNDDAKK